MSACQAVQSHSPRGICSVKSRSQRHRLALLVDWSGHRGCDTQTAISCFAAPCSRQSCLLESCPSPRNRWATRTIDRPARTNTKITQVRDAGNSSMQWNGGVVSLRTTGELVKVHTTVCYFVWRKDSKQNMFSNTPGSLCEDSRFLNIRSRPFDKFWLHFLQAPLQLLHTIEGETPNSLLK